MKNAKTNSAEQAEAVERATEETERKMGGEAIYEKCENELRIPARRLRYGPVD